MTPAARRLPGRGHRRHVAVVELVGLVAVGRQPVGVQHEHGQRRLRPGHARLDEHRQVIQAGAQREVRGHHAQRVGPVVEGEHRAEPGAPAPRPAPPTAARADRRSAPDPWGRRAARSGSRRASPRANTPSASGRCTGRITWRRLWLAGSASAWNSVGTASARRWRIGRQQRGQRRHPLHPVRLPVARRAQVGEAQPCVSGCPAFQPSRRCRSMASRVMPALSSSSSSPRAERRAEHRRADAAADQPGEQARSTLPAGPARPGRPGSSRSTSARPAPRRCRGCARRTKSGLSGGRSAGARAARGRSRSWHHLHRRRHGAPTSVAPAGQPGVQARRRGRPPGRRRG